MLTFLFSLCFVSIVVCESIFGRFSREESKLSGNSFPQKTKRKQLQKIYACASPFSNSFPSFSLCNFSSRNPWPLCSHKETFPPNFGKICVHERRTNYFSPQIGKRRGARDLSGIADQRDKAHKDEERQYRVEIPAHRRAVAVFFNIHNLEFHVTIPRRPRHRRHLKHPLALQQERKAGSEQSK